jgi:hypothetical protein
MPLIEASSILATLVGLICNWKQERGAQATDRFQDFMVWLSHHNFEDIRERIYASGELQRELATLLQQDFTVLGTKMRDLRSSGQDRFPHFMQAAGGGDDNFLLEFMEFSQDGLWEHKDSTGVGVNIDIVVQAFIQYANDDDVWRELDWVRLSGEEADRRSDAERVRLEEEKPQPGFFKTIGGGLLGVLLIELGIVGKGRK